MKKRITSVALLVILCSTLTLGQSVNNNKPVQVELPDSTLEIFEQPLERVDDPNEIIALDNKHFEVTRDPNLPDGVTLLDEPGGIIALDNKHIEVTRDPNLPDGVTLLDEPRGIITLDNKYFEVSQYRSLYNNSDQRNSGTSDMESHVLDTDQLLVAPNPSSGNFKLSFDLEGTGTTSYQILDVTGKVVYQVQLGSFTGTYSADIDLSEFGTGVYFLQLIQGDKATTQKIIVS